jgi:hypothetical protein
MATSSLRSLLAERQAAAVVLAQQAAMRIVKRQIKAQGRVKLSTLSAATLTRLGNDYLREHPELIAEAAADPIVQNSQVSFKRRRPAAQGLPLCKSQVQKSALTGVPQQGKIEGGL